MFPHWHSTFSMHFRSGKTYHRHSPAGKIPVSYRCTRAVCMRGHYEFTQISLMIPFAHPLTRYGIVEFIIAEGDPPWRSLDNRLLKFVVLRGQRLQRRGEDLILLHLMLQFHTAHLRSTHKHTSTHTNTNTHTTLACDKWSNAVS